MGKRGLVIFDLDGTLFRAEAVTVPAVRMAFRERGVPVPPEDQIRRFIGRPSSEFHAWVREICPPGVGAELARAVDNIEVELLSEMGELYPNIPEVLATLRASVAQMAICTSGSREYVEAVVAAYDLGRFFDAVRFRQSRHDDKVSMVGDLLGQLEARPAIVIGDRTDDIEAAHRNDLPAIAVAYGMGDVQALASAEALAESPSDLAPLVRLFVQPT